MVDRLAAEEGLLCGPSSGAAVRVACEVAMRDEAEGKTVVVVIPSSGIRYVTHPMWVTEKGECAEVLKGPPDFSNDPPLLRFRSEDFVKPAKKKKK
jgi:cysteine synthase A